VAEAAILIFSNDRFAGPQPGLVPLGGFTLRSAGRPVPRPIEGLDAHSARVTATHHSVGPVVGDR
jgi:hypothetical protein